MTIESEIQKIAGAPAGGADRPKPESVELLACGLGGVRRTLQSVRYYDDVSKSYKDPVLVYREQFRDDTGKYVSVPSPVTASDVQSLVDFYKSLKEVMRQSGIDALRTVYVNDDVKGAVEYIKANLARKGGA
jgi:hypothetical protein